MDVVPLESIAIQPVEVVLAQILIAPIIVRWPFAPSRAATPTDAGTFRRLSPASPTRLEMTSRLAARPTFDGAPVEIHRQGQDDAGTPDRLHHFARWLRGR